MVATYLLNSKYTKMFLQFRTPIRKLTAATSWWREKKGHKKREGRERKERLRKRKKGDWSQKWWAAIPGV